MTTRDAVSWLFVPGTRDDRFDRAAASGADEIILDLEDAVAPEAKDEARERVATWLDGGGSGWVRINAVETDWYERDLAVIVGRVGLRGLVVPKAESVHSMSALRDRLPSEVGVVALVESALGIDQASRIATSGAVDRIAFGAIDFALDIGAEENDVALLFARSALVIASRVGALPAPLDGVTVSTTDDAESRAAAAQARSLGFGGKLCIHPRQLEPVAAGFRPTAAELDWAARVLAASSGDEGSFAVDGQMIDRPVLARARAVMSRGGGLE